MTKRICDRCGKNVSTPMYIRSWNGEGFDLCDDCQNLFIQWINNRTNCDADTRDDEQWISVKNRLPEVGKNVLVCFSDGDITIGWRHIDESGDSVWIEQDEDITEVLHESEYPIVYWMPLPEPC